MWEAELQPLLEAEGGDKLEAKTLMQLLVDRDPQRFSMSQLRTMQRRVRDWRATRGPDKEVFFEQVHEAGHEAGLDFTCANSLEVTIEGQWPRHLLFELVLVHSTWTWACVAFSETFEALIDGLQRALWTLGGVPHTLVMDNVARNIIHLLCPQPLCGPGQLPCIALGSPKATEQRSALGSGSRRVEALRSSLDGSRSHARPKPQCRSLGA